MDKNEAMKRLDAIEAEAKELRRIIERPEVDPREWVGKWGFYSDTDPNCHASGNAAKLFGYDSTVGCPYRLNLTSWRYFRPATAEELGFAPETKPDWSKAPKWAKWWARDAHGGAFWYEDSPHHNECMHLARSRKERDETSCPNWCNTLTKRP